MGFFGGTPIVAALLIAALLVYAFRRERLTGSPPPSTADILNRRFAAGEISIEQYREATRELRGEPKR